MSNYIKCTSFLTCIISFFGLEAAAIKQSKIYFKKVYLQIASVDKGNYHKSVKTMTLQHSFRGLYVQICIGFTVQDQFSFQIYRIRKSQEANDKHTNLSFDSHCKKMNYVAELPLIQSK